MFVANNPHRQIPQRLFLTFFGWSLFKKILAVKRLAAKHFSTSFSKIFFSISDPRNEFTRNFLCPVRKTILCQSPMRETNSLEIFTMWCEKRFMLKSDPRNEFTENFQCPIWNTIGFSVWLIFREMYSSSMLLWHPLMIEISIGSPTSDGLAKLNHGHGNASLSRMVVIHCRGACSVQDQAMNLGEW